jgi:hypothetical protein
MLQAFFGTARVVVLRPGQAGNPYDVADNGLIVLIHKKDGTEMMQIRMLLVMLFLGALSLPAFGGDYSTLTSTELKAMIDRNVPGLVIIDSRSQSQYEETHIKGAVNIPLMDMEQNPALPEAPKDARLVFYCSGNT